MGKTKRIQQWKLKEQWRVRVVTSYCHKGSIIKSIVVNDAAPTAKTEQKQVSGKYWSH